MKKTQILFATMTLALSLVPLAVSAQQVLDLETCRQMAVQNNKELEMSRVQIEMAGYDRKIARANYFPNISATAAYMYNDQQISLISDNMSAQLGSLGSTSMQTLGTAIQGLPQSIAGLAQSLPQESLPALMQLMQNPLIQNATQLFQNPVFQGLISNLGNSSLAQAINGIGQEIDDATHVNIHNLFIGAVSLQQPLFMGGKIVNANRIAKMAEQLSKSQFDQKYQETLVGVDQSYWQIVSVAHKLELSKSYAALLHDMERDVNLAVAEGVATESDALQIKVKANEADMLLTRATNGLQLAKMLLCKQIGLDLNTPITLKDENTETIATPEMSPDKDMEQIYTDRPELRSLELAAKIYEKKVKVARADMIPSLGLMANYIVSNPNPYNGFEKSWGGMFNVGAALKIPILHGLEARNKTRKAKAEATYYQLQWENAKDLINLQVNQLRTNRDEATKRLVMAENNLASAEENLRKATLGFSEGVIDANTALAAHTAWLQAHSEYIDAGIELQMNNINLQKAEGNFKSNNE